MEKLKVGDLVTKDPETFPTKQVFKILQIESRKDLSDLAYISAPYPCKCCGYPHYTYIDYKLGCEKIDINWLRKAPKELLPNEKLRPTKTK